MIFGRAIGYEMNSKVRGFGKQSRPHASSPENAQDEARPPHGIVKALADFIAYPERV
jgi:hypothetical protein